ncbi:MAG: peptidase S8 and S53 subtilisin kexin sedolisin [Meiothermus sp.]
MRAVFWILLSLLAGCASDSTGLLGMGGPMPVEVVMGGSTGSLPVRVGPKVAWKIQTDADWLTVSPTQGLGSGTVRLEAKPTGDPADGRQYLAKLEVSGDLKTEVTVRLPLVQVFGQISDAGTAQALQTQSGQSLGALGLRPRKTPPPTGEILVKYRQTPQRNRLPQDTQLRAVDPAAHLVKLRSDSPQALLDRLRRDPNVEWAEPNGYVTAQGEPTDEFYPKQWYLKATGARFSYLGSFPKPVTVAVIDTGVRYDHPDLAGRLVLPGQGAYDFVQGDNDPTDPGDRESPTGGSHGTHVTGIITARSGTFAAPCPTCSTSGIVGVAYNAPVKVLPLRVLDETGNGTFENVALAVRYAAGLPVTVNNQTLQNPAPAQVINLSLGALTRSEAMCDAVADAVAKGVLVVAAAGNYQADAPGQPVYPASCGGVISVAATDPKNQVAWYSQQNSSVSLAVPGGDTGQGLGAGILSTTWDFRNNQPNYTYYMGTSQASPQVAAALGLVLSSGLANTGPEAWALLKAKLTHLGTPGRNNVYGDGFLNLPAVFGWPLPKGGYAVNLEGPTDRRLSAPSGTFSTYVIPGAYTITVCRDDSDNGLCDQGEPHTTQNRNVPAGASFDLGVLALGL